MDNEIKVGDKVRVREDAPIHIIGSASEIKCKAVVFGTDADIAVIGFRTREEQRYDAYKIPTKHLIKVEDEAKEPRFKKGDRVKFKNIYELQKVKAASFHWMLTMFASKEATITAVEDNGFYRVDIDPSIGGINDDMIESKVEPTAPTIKVGDVIDTPKGKGTVHISYGDYWVVQLDNGEWYIHMGTNMHYAPCAEPTEPTEDEIIRQREAEFDEFRKEELDRVLHPEKYTTYEVTIDNMAMDWQRYTADLAKEIALKVANKYNNPKEAADCAVSVAKAVVENLKKK